MTKRYRKLTPEVRKAVMRLAARGATYRQILEEVDISAGNVGVVLVPLGGVIRRECLERPASRLSAEDRVEIRLGLEHNMSYARIGERIGRHASTVCREVNNNGGRSNYRPLAAHRQATVRAARPKPTKLASAPALCARVTSGLERLWSPEQIALKLKAEFGNDPAMTVSHETIYKSLYVQGRGELRRELTAALRTGRAKRRPQGRVRPPRLSNMVMISERPAEVEDRAVPGHWEGDLIMGKNGKSAIGTLVERTTRYVMFLHLPGDHTAETVRVAMTEAILTLPESMRRSVTWDQGNEMAQHTQFSVDTGVDVYFCDPHAPWQRGSNENTNGLARQYFPKGTDLSIHTPADLRAAADSLNSRPRKTLGVMTPSEALDALIAATG